MTRPYLLEATQDPTGWWLCIARATVHDHDRPSRVELVTIAAGEGPTMDDAIEACEREIAYDEATTAARLWPE